MFYDSVFVVDWGIFFPCTLASHLRCQSHSWHFFNLDFYFQLFSILHGIDAQVAFYSVRCPSSWWMSVILITSHTQVAILNAGAIPGRIIPNMLADHFGTYNMAIPFLTACGILIFAMIGVKTVAGMVVVTILYGFMSGAGTYDRFCHASLAVDLPIRSSGIDWACICSPISRSKWSRVMSISHMSSLPNVDIASLEFGSELPFPWLLLALWWGARLMEHSSEKPSLG